MGFAEMASELQAHLKSNLPQVMALLKQNPGMAYSRIAELGSEVGKRHGVRLIVNFPQEGKIKEFEMYGRRDLSVIVDQSKTRFPIGRQKVRQKALETLPNARAEDAYMYEGKEGLKVFMETGRMDILPHSLHIWCELGPKETEFCSWLFENVYKKS